MENNQIQESLNKLNFRKVGIDTKINLGQVAEAYGGEGLDLVVVLDTSSSMTEAIEGRAYTSKIKAAWECLQEVLVRHLAGWGLSVMLFGGTYGFQGWEWIAKPKDDLKRMRQPDAYGGTPLLNAMREVWHHGKSSERCRVILLTDGMPDGGQRTQNEILALAEQNKGIIVDCIGVSGGGYDPRFLQELARITGGIFCEIKDTTQLWDTMKILSPELRKLPPGYLPLKDKNKVINL